MMLTENWNPVWNHFARSTTFHGIVKLSEDTTFRARRFMWLVIVLSGLTLFVYQSTERILFYLGRPVNVYNLIKHNDSIIFPAVVICNANNFRLSAAYDQGLYDMLDIMYSSQRSDELDDIKSANLTLADVLATTAHQKEDMILKCTWDDEDCGPDTFSTTLTDHGVCYTFNNEPPYKVVKRTGAARGLRLMINVEQYEYMKGPDSSAGLKLLIHPHNEASSVVNLAQAIPIGMHAFVGVDLKEVENLGEPYGSCVTDVGYSHSACLLECETRLTVEMCGCRDFFMPVTADHVSKRKVECACPVPCRYMVYNGAVSYASMPLNELDSIALDNKTASRLLNNLIIASETAQHAFAQNRKADIKMIGESEERIQELLNAVRFVCTASGRLANNVTSLMAEIEDRIWFHYTWGMERVKFTIFHDFVRLWQVVDERTLMHVTTGYLQFIEKSEDTFKMLSGDNTTDDLQRMTRYEILENDLNFRKNLASRALSNLTHIQDGFVNGTTRFIFRASPKRHYDKQWMPPELFFTNKYRETLYESWYSLLVNYTNILGCMQRMNKQVFESRTYDASLLKHYLEMFSGLSATHNSLRSEYYINIVQYTAEIVEKKVANFLQMNSTLYNNADNVNKTFTSISSSAAKMNTSSFLGRAMSCAYEYRVNKTLIKLECARMLVSKETKEDIAAMNTWIKDLRQRSVQMMDHWKTFCSSFINIYRSVLDETYTSSVYEAVTKDFDHFTSLRMNSSFAADLVEIWSEMLHISEGQLLNLTNKKLSSMLNADISKINTSFVISNLSRALEIITDNNTLTNKLVDEMDMVVLALDTLQRRFRSYISSTDLDGNFYSVISFNWLGRQNVLQMNIYMKQLSYESVLQQSAYDINALLSDIGGAMGLCIGASAISVFEIFDAFFIHAVGQYILPKRKIGKSEEEGTSKKDDQCDSKAPQIGSEKTPDAKLAKDSNVDSAKTSS